MTSINRRKFTSVFAYCGLGLLTIKLTGCGSSADSRTQNDESKPGIAPGVAYGIVVYDLQMTGWSTLGSGRLGPNGTLKATTIRDSKAVTLKYIQDGDGHEFTLSPADFDKIIKGQVVEILTTEAAGHRHRVIIDPKLRAQNAQSVEIPDAVIPGSPSSEKIYISIEQAEQPRLFMQGTKPLDPATVEYCIDTEAACNASPTLWQKAKIHLDQTDRQVMVSDTNLILDLNKTELPLNIRGKLKSNAELVKAALKLTRK